MQNEKTVERVADAVLNTEFGPFRVLTYQDVVSRQVHFALVKGEIHPKRAVLVRVHVQHLLSDLLTLRLPDSGWPLRDALQRVANEPAGVLVFLSHPEDPAALIRRMRGYQFGLPKRRAPPTSPPNCAPTASAPKSCSTSACGECGCSALPSASPACPASISKSWNTSPENKLSRSFSTHIVTESPMHEHQHDRRRLHAASQDARFALVAARFNSFIVQSLINGAVDTLRRHGVPKPASI
jgi:hypothetical protein